MLCTYFSESKEVGLMEKKQPAQKTAPGRGEFGNEIQVGQIAKVYKTKKRNLWKSVKDCRTDLGAARRRAVFSDSL